MGYFSQDKKYWIVLLASIAVFVLVLLKGLTVYMPGDEHKWHYSGYLVSKGYLPYKDFFYGHPPIQSAVLSLVFLLFGFNIIALKLVEFGSAIAICIIIFLILRKKEEKLAGIVASVLFLFTYSIMFNSSVSFGLMLATMIAMIGYYFLERKNYAAAGAIFAIACLTRLLVIIPIFLVFAWLFFSERVKLKKYHFGFFAYSLLQISSSLRFLEIAILNRYTSFTCSKTQ